MALDTRAIAFTDSQLATIMRLAAPLPIECRDRYLQLIAMELAGRDFGNSDVLRVAMHAARVRCTALRLRNAGRCRVPPRQARPVLRSGSARRWPILLGRPSLLLPKWRGHRCSLWSAP
jgi:hypothetical protein